MRRHAAPGPPGLGHLGERLGVRPLAQAEGDARRFLHCEVAGGKSIGVAETEQQINVGAPRSDAVQRDEGCVRGVCVHVADGVEIDLAFSEGLADFTNGFDLGRGEAKPLELFVARFPHRIVMKRIEGRKQPVADRRGAGSRQLLPADDGAQAGKARLAPAQGERAGFIGHGFEARIGFDEPGETGVEIGLGVQEVGHGGPHIIHRSSPRKRGPGQYA